MKDLRSLIESYRNQVKVKRMAETSDTVTFEVTLKMPSDRGWKVLSDLMKGRVKHESEVKWRKKTMDAMINGGFAQLRHLSSLGYDVVELTTIGWSYARAVEKKLLEKKRQAGWGL